MKVAFPFIQAMRRGSLVDLEKGLSRSCALSYNYAGGHEDDKATRVVGKAEVAAYLKRFRDNMISRADTTKKPATYNFYRIRPVGWWVTAEAVGPDVDLPTLGNVPWQGQFWLSGVYEERNTMTAAIRNVVIIGDISLG